MVNPTEQKMFVKNTIMKILRRDGFAAYDVLVSGLKLDTGFTDKIIAAILKDLGTVGLLKIEGNTVTLTDQGKEVKP